MTVEVCRPDDPDVTRVHSIRFQAITDENDQPDYLVLIIEAETDRFEAEDRFESAFNANPAPAIICRIADLRYVRVNRGFLEMTGFGKDDVIGRSAYEFDVLAGSEGREDALEKLSEGKTIPQNEAEIALPDGSSKIVIVAGQPIEISDESCMLFTFADLEPRRRAEGALRQSEERFSKAFRLSPVAASIHRIDRFHFIEVNEAFTRMTGYAEEQVIGRNAVDLDLWSDRSAQMRFEAALKSSGSVRDLDFDLRTSDGNKVSCLLAAEKIVIGEVDCVLCIMQDITERKRSETELVAAIETVMSDTSWFSRRIVEKLAVLRQTSASPAGGADLDSLSDRERDVLGLICQGLGDKEMASTLNLSPHTVRNHVSSLYRKIGVTRRGAAVVWARERGVVDRKAAKNSPTSKR